MDPNTGPINDDQAQSPAVPAEAPSWPIPAGGFATAPPPVPRPVSRLRHWAILGGAAGGVVALVVGVAVIRQLLNKAGTTKNFVLVSPPPQAVPGLVQDSTAESQPGYKARVTHIQQLYSRKFGLPPSGGVIAVYQASGSALPTIDNVVIYLGFRMQENDNTSASIKSAIRGFAARLINATTVPVDGGFGDTSFECATGNGFAATQIPGPVTVCGWATDRTVAFLLREGPDPGAKKLSTLMVKIWPKLVHR
jgi:hypothetical protein